MIYIIDDNKTRQKNSGWSEEILNKFKDFVHPIYNFEGLNEEVKNEIFKTNNNVILFHESFFDNPINKTKEDVNKIKDKLNNYNYEDFNSFYVSFSGSNKERKLRKDNRSASAPVSVIYDNLEHFILKFKNEKRYDLKTLLYGKNTSIEPELFEQLEKAKVNYINEQHDIEKNIDNVFLFRSKYDVNPPFSNYSTILNKETENGLHKKVVDCLSDGYFDSVFVPLCFGPSLSDYNGLRLATHIRCTQTKNQLSRIFIYSFLDTSEYLNDLLNHECFNILKIKNIELIAYSKKVFQDAVLKPITKFELKELSKELNKLKLEVPDNYEDNHSIANEFGIYQLSYNAGIDISEITDFDSKKLESLYFKWLIAKNGLNEKLPEKQEKENKDYRHKLRGIIHTGQMIDLSKFK